MHQVWDAETARAATMLVGDRQFLQDHVTIYIADAEAIEAYYAALATGEVTVTAGSRLYSDGAEAAVSKAATTLPLLTVAKVNQH